MTMRLLPAVWLAAAGLLLAACQTTGGSTTSFAAIEQQACLELGFTPGTQAFDDCSQQIGRDVALFRSQLENEFKPLEIVTDCVIEVEGNRYQIICSRRLF